MHPGIHPVNSVKLCCGFGLLLRRLEGESGLEGSGLSFHRGGSLHITQGSLWVGDGRRRMRGSNEQNPA